MQLRASLCRSAPQSPGSLLLCHSLADSGARPASRSCHKQPVCSAAYAKTKETVDAQLSSALSAQISDMLDARQLLESSQRRLKHLRQSIGEIDRLCGETGFLIERYDLISSLSTARYSWL